MRSAFPVGGLLGHAYGRAGRLDEAPRIRDELQELAQTTYVPAYELVLVNIGLGDRNAALDWLERAAGERNAMTLHSARAYPQFEPLYGEPRFQEFCRRLGLAAEL